MNLSAWSDDLGFVTTRSTHQTDKLFIFRAGNIGDCCGLPSRLRAVALGEPEMIKNTGQNLYKHLNFSADGRFMAYSAISTAGNIWSVRISPAKAEATGPPEPLTHDTELPQDRFPCFRRTEARLPMAFVKSAPTWSIWLMDVDGRNARPLTAGSHSAWLVPRRRTAGIHFPSGEDERPGCRLTIETGRKERLREIYGTGRHPRLSPDGKQIAYNSAEGGTINICTAPVEGGPPRQLTFDKEMMGFLPGRRTENSSPSKSNVEIILNVGNHSRAAGERPSNSPPITARASVRLVARGRQDRFRGAAQRHLERLVGVATGQDRETDYPLFENQQLHPLPDLVASRRSNRLRIHRNDRKHLVMRMK